MYRINFVLYSFLIFVFSLCNSAYAEKCGRLCDYKWISTASVSEVKIELDKKPLVLTSKEFDETPLHLAARYNSNPEVTEFLIKNGADLNARSKDFEGASPLHYAAGKSTNLHFIRNHLVASAYGRHGPTGNQSYENFIQWREKISTINSKTNVPMVFSALLDAGAIATQKNQAGQTPLHLAASGSIYPEIIELLVEYGAKVSTRDKTGMTPLHYAALNNSNPAIAEVLVRYGAGLDVESYGLKIRPIHSASTNIHPQTLLFFLKRTADVNVPTHEGQTPLHLAALHPHIGWIVKLLMEYGADLDKQDERGETPLHLALRQRNYSAATILVEGSANVNIENRDGVTAREFASKMCEIRNGKQKEICNHVWQLIRQ